MAQYPKLKMKELSVEDRPREKMLTKGISHLSEAELIAILLGSGSNRESAVELARRILSSYQNNLQKLGKAQVDELKNKFHGVGVAKAVTIVAAMELGRRRLLEDPLEKPSIKGSIDAYQIMLPTIGHLPHEEFWILFLNRANRVEEKYNVSKGGIVGTIVDIRLIMKRALDTYAAAMILVHNHPSGNIQPSDADISLTKQLKDAGALMDIPVLDHIIVTENGYFSFSDHGMM